MGKKLTSVYAALLKGAHRGLSGYALYHFVSDHCEVSSDKRICRASLLAMSDPNLPSRDVMEGIYSIATDHRMRCSG